MRTAVFKIIFCFKWHAGFCKCNTLVPWRKSSYSLFCKIIPSIIFQIEIDICTQAIYSISKEVILGGWPTCLLFCTFCHHFIICIYKKGNTGKKTLNGAFQLQSNVTFRVWDSQGLKAVIMFKKMNAYISFYWLFINIEMIILIMRGLALEQPGT